MSYIPVITALHISLHRSNIRDMHQLHTQAPLVFFLNHYTQREFAPYQSENRIRNSVTWHTMIAHPKTVNTRDKANIGNTVHSNIQSTSTVSHTPWTVLWSTSIALQCPSRQCLECPCSRSGSDRPRASCRCWVWIPQSTHQSWMADFLRPMGESLNPSQQLHRPSDWPPMQPACQVADFPMATQSL